MLILSYQFTILINYAQFALPLLDMFQGRLIGLPVEKNMVTFFITFYVVVPVVTFE